LFIRQRVGAAVQIVYLGGVSLTRTTNTLEVSISQQVPGPFPLPDRVSNSLRTYDAGAALGAEVRWRVTAHATLAPGLRVVTLPDEWVVRPLLAAGWTF
jgi:hypothetical protein